MYWAGTGENSDDHLYLYGLTVTDPAKPAPIKALQTPACPRAPRMTVAVHLSGRQVTVTVRTAAGARAARERPPPRTQVHVFAAQRPSEADRHLHGRPRLEERERQPDRFDPALSVPSATTERSSRPFFTTGGSGT